MSTLITVTPPVVGDPPRLDTFGQPVIDGINALNALVAGVAAAALIPNSSFEEGTLADTDPSGWSLSIAAGNHTAFETSAGNTVHGAQALSMSNPSGVTGGVTATSVDYILCAAGQTVSLGWWFMTSVATTTNAVKLKFYTAAGSLVSTSTLYSASSGHPTAWTWMEAQVAPPATAKYLKIVLEGVNSAVIGTTYWDGLILRLYYPVGFNKLIFTATQYWTCPLGVYAGEGEGMGSGGGGGGGGGDNYKGGGGGGSATYKRSNLTLVPLQTYLITIPAGGTGGIGTAGGTTGGNGGAGSATTFDTLLSIPGGQGGLGGTSTNQGAGGAAGTGTAGLSSGVVTLTGDAGSGGISGAGDQNGAAGGGMTNKDAAGVRAFFYPVGGAQTTAPGSGGTNGNAGSFYGGGGGGGTGEVGVTGGKGGDGGAGAPAIFILSW